MGTEVSLKILGLERENQPDYKDSGTTLSGKRC